MSAATDSLHGVYAITPDANDFATTLSMTARLIQAGVGVVQYRNKHSSAPARRRQAAQLRDLCRETQTFLLINDDVDLALAVEADGVHLGQQDTPVAQARDRLGDEAIVGVTCHNSPELAQTAALAGASYVAFGRFFSSSTKPAGLADIEVITRAGQVVGLPKVAIGGIHRGNANGIVEAGAEMIALCEALYGSSEPEQLVLHLKGLF